MTELQAIQQASQYRQLGQFYGEAMGKPVGREMREHYAALAQVCEERAYLFEMWVLRGAIVEGGNLNNPAEPD